MVCLNVELNFQDIKNGNEHLSQPIEENNTYSFLL